MTPPPPRPRVTKKRKPPAPVVAVVENWRYYDLDKAVIFVLLEVLERAARRDLAVLADLREELDRETKLIEEGPHAG